MDDPKTLLLELLQRTTGRYVATRVGVTPVTISRWKTGEREITSWQHADAIRRLHKEMCGEAA